jgi:hypothetical protein
MPSDEIDKILSCIGKKVHYKYRGAERSQHGILKDRAVVKSQYGGPVPYWDVVDLIEFEGEEEPECIRIGYYRKPGQNLNWGAVKRQSQRRCQAGKQCSLRPHGKRIGFVTCLTM